MSTDLRKRSAPPTALGETVFPKAERTARWHYVAAGFLLVAIAAVTVLLFTHEGAPPSSTLRRQGVADALTGVRENGTFVRGNGSSTVTDPMTGVREGSGYVRQAPGLGYLNPMTESREGSGSTPIAGVVGTRSGPQGRGLQADRPSVRELFQQKQ